MMFFSAADILGYSSALTAAAYGRSRAQALAFCLAALCFLGKRLNIRCRERDLHQSHWLESRRYFSKDEPAGFVLIAHYMCN